MKTSNIDKAFSKMPKMIHVPQVPQMNNFMGYNQQPVQQYNSYNQYAQMYPGYQSIGYPQQQQQQYQQQMYQTGYPPQLPQNQQYFNQTQPTLQQPDNQNFAQEYTKYYIEYWNNYYEQLKNGEDPNAQQSNLKEQSVSSINDRYISDKKQQQQTLDKIDSIKEKEIDLLRSSKSKTGRYSIESKDHNISKIRQAITEEANEAKSELSVDSDILREEYRKKQILPDEEDLIPVNQQFLLEQSIDEDDYDKYIPECKAEPNQKVLEDILLMEKQEREKQEKIQREIKEKEDEEERIRQQELKEQMEHEQFYEDNPEIYLEHRRQQKKVIFETLKLEMDRLIEKTQNVEADLFEADKGLTQIKKETEQNNIKRKKTEFYLRAKKLQRDIDNIIDNNKEEELAETNFELLKGLHESIVDDQLERMYEKNQLLFLQVSQALQEISGVHNQQGTFQQYHYYESLKTKAKKEVETEKKQMEKKRKLYENLLPPQKSLRKNVVTFSKDKKRSNSKNASPDKKKAPLHKKAWGQH